MSYFHLHFLCNQMLVTLDISILPPWFSYWNVYFSENCCMMRMRFSHDGHLRHFLGSMVDKFLSIWWLLSFLLYKSFRITWPFSLISAWFVFFPCEIIIDLLLNHTVKSLFEFLGQSFFVWFCCWHEEKDMCSLFIYWMRPKETEFYVSVLFFLSAFFRRKF